VRRLQGRLHSLGDKPGPIDGLYGPLTERAVRRFQRRARIAVDGIVGPRTLSALRAARDRSSRPRSVGPPRSARAPAAPATTAAAGTGRHNDWSGVLSVGLIVAAVAALPLLAVWLEERLAKFVRWLGRRLSRSGRRPVEAAESVVGYVSAPYAHTGEELSEFLDAQVAAIEADCRRRAWRLVEVVRDFDPDDRRGLDRPPLAYTRDLLASNRASCLVVTDLDRLTPSAADFSTLMDELAVLETRLIATGLGLDTHTPEGQVVATAVMSLGEGEAPGVVEEA
jgi:hypothetical protein